MLFSTSIAKHNGEKKETENTVSKTQIQIRCEREQETSKRFVFLWQAVHLRKFQEASKDNDRKT